MGSVTWPSRPRERGAGDQCQTLSRSRLPPSDPGPSLWRCRSVIKYRSVMVAKYHKYSSDIQINVVKVSLPHTLF